MGRMPIAFAPLLGFALGAALAWTSAPVLERDDAPIALSRPFAIAVAFAAVVWLPVVAYFVAFHGDWSYLYLVAWRDVPSAIDLALVLLAAGALPAGFAAATPSVRKRRWRPVLAAIAVPAGLAILGFAAAARRLAVSGTYAQYHGDFGTEPIGASALGKGVLLMGVVLVLAVAWTARSLVRLAAHKAS